MDNIPLISISDIHIGHNKISSHLLCHRLKKYFFPHISQRSFVTINGDIFDKNLTLSNPDTSLVIDWFIQLFNLLEKHDSYLRIIRGTYAHDRDQIQSIVKLYQANNYTFNFKYFDKISIEIIPELNHLKILYIPDDLPFNSSSEVIRFIHQKLQQLNISHVDYIFGHGNFQHVFSNNISLPKITFTLDQFQSIVIKYIIFGHVHVHSINKNMIYTGSFDRTRHGEPNAKGFIKIPDFISNSSNLPPIQFIKNPEATQFIDIHFNDHIPQNDSNRLSEFLDHVDNIISNKFSTSNTSYIRFIDVPSEFKYSIKDYIENNYDYIHVSFYTSKHIQQSSSNIITNLDSFKINIDNSLTLSKDNILKYIQKELLNQYNTKISLDKLSNYIFQ